MGLDASESHAPERLVQIASRKLTSLGIAHAVLPDRRAAEGALKFAPGRLSNPINGVPVTRGRFVTVGHDRVRFLDPPLASLGTFPFFEAQTPTEVETAVAVSLLDRAAGLEKVRARLAALRLEPSLDADAMVVRASLKTLECTFELEALPGVVRVRRLRDPSGVTEISDAFSPVDLDEFPAAVDLELHLSDALPRIRAAAARPAEPGKAPQSGAPTLVLEPAPPPRGATTLGQLAARFGPDAYLIPGDQIEIVQTFTAAGASYRFTAVHDVGASFKAKITGPKGVVWQDRIELDRFPGPAKVVSSATAVPLADAAPPPSAEAPPTSGAPPTLTPAQPGPSASAPPVPAWAVPPHPGEIWVMHAMVESRTAEQVRYVCVDADARPVGAVQALAASDFERLFVPHGPGFRLRVEIASVDGDSVLYRQVDSSGKRSKTPRTVPVATLLATFVPEAGAY